MSSETTGQTVTVKTGEAVAATGPAAVKGEWKVRGNKDLSWMMWAMRYDT